ncbi:MAG: inositol monophosphatase [Proteobacteria bacterium]|nr:inositol monophosphatase [Pseudomonadota bacterium]MBU1710183.1 inositol monophosphatase [Pseudomonadota bacterium]
MDLRNKSFGKPDDKRLSPILQLAGRAALEAGKVVRDLYGKPHDIRRKGNIDLVTEADTAAEVVILDILKASSIQADFLAEESSGLGSFAIPQGPTWVIDPLDGTTNFAHGFPWFGVSIGYMEKGKPMAGVIYCPMQDELFSAAAGCGAWLNNDPIKVSEADALGISLMATGFPYTIQEDAEAVMAALKAVLTKCQGVRRAGAAALDLAYVACGRLDGFWEIQLKPWDTAAGQIILEEAGGKLTDFKGKGYSPFVQELLATNSLIHAELVEVLGRFSVDEK